MESPKIVLWDIETSGITTTSWNLYPESISHENMLSDWFIISVAWKALGDKKMNVVSVLDDKKRFKRDNTDDYHVIKTIRAALDDVDILVHHNGNAFDIKSFNSRLIFHKLPPLPKFQMVDTLREIKKVAKFTSHRLDFLGKVLCGEGKKHIESGTWLKAMRGDEKAIKLMVEYNKKDVIVLEKVYNRLLPYMKSHPMIGAMMGVGKHSCNKCGSTEFSPSGNKLRYSATGAQKLQKQCAKCHSYSTFTIDKKDGK